MHIERSGRHGRGPIWQLWPLTLASVFLATPAGAQNAVAAPLLATTADVGLRRMNLDEARAYARAHQPRLLAARQRLVAAQSDARVPGAQWLPRIGAMGQVVGGTANNSTSTLLGTSVVDLPRIGGTKVEGTAEARPYATTGVALGIRQELLDFGRIAAEQNAATLASEVERFRVLGAGFDVDLGVEQAYFAVRAALSIAEASRGAYDRAVQHRDQARANVQSGMRPPIELTRAEADVARYEAGMVRANASVHVARSVFAVAVGVDDVELDAQVMPEESPELPALEAALRGAERGPALQEAQARLRAQAAETRRLELQTRPNLSATAAISARAGGATPSSGPVPWGDGWAPVVPNYDVGVVLTWPFLEPTLGRRADASRERERALSYESSATLRVQRGIIAAAYFDADVARQALAALTRGADAARANYEQAENRFRVGLGTSTELADAQALRTEADIQLAIGKFQVSKTRAVLQRAIAETP
jgi:outer membrane protein